MKTEIKLSKGLSAAETSAREKRSSRGLCLRSNRPFDVASYVKRDRNYSLGLASFIK